MGPIVCTLLVHDCIRLFLFVHLLLFYLSQEGLGTCYPFLILDSKMSSIWMLLTQRWIVRERREVPTKEDIRKGGDSMSPAPSGRGRKKSKRCTNKKRCIQSCTNKIQTIEPILESKIRNGGDSMFPALPGSDRKVRRVQTKKDVYNHVLTKYKRLSPFSNPKSEKWDSMLPAPWER